MAPAAPSAAAVKPRAAFAIRMSAMKSTAELKTLLPTAMLAAAGLWLAIALALGRVPMPHLPAILDIAQAEIDSCERVRARSHDACVQEAEGKAVIRRAEWVAAVEEDRRAAAEIDASAAAPKVIVVRPPRPLAR
jgi:hypothetical protein